jgi:hypothetical protein
MEEQEKTTARGDSDTVILAQMKHRSDSDSTTFTRRILSSAAPLGFLLLCITACMGFIFGILLSTDFMMLAGMAFTCYFTKTVKGTAYTGK